MKIQGRHRFLIFIIALISCFVYSSLASSSTKKVESSREIHVYIPAEVIDSLKIGDIEGAIRNLRMEATSTRTKYLLRELQRIETSKTDIKKSRGKDHRALFNVGISYHNLFLFLQRNGFESRPFFKKGLKYYQMAQQTESPSRKNLIVLNMAALYAARGDEKMTAKLFNKIDPSSAQEDFQWNQSLALYYSARVDVEKAVQHIEAAYNANPEYTKFLLAVSDDYHQISNHERFQALLKKWNVPINRETQLPYLSKGKEIVH